MASQCVLGSDFGDASTSSVVVKNIYYMMAYAFRALELDEYRKLLSEEFDNVADLLAAILSLGMAAQRRRGFERCYDERRDTLKAPKGRLDVAGIARLRAAQSQDVPCSFDEFTDNTYMNRILKTTALYLLGRRDVRDETKQDLKRTLVFMRSIDVLDAARVDWSRCRYHRNNASYQLLMNVCYMALRGRLASTREGGESLADLLDAQALHALYENFVLEYYRKHHAHLNPSAPILKEGLSEDAPAFLPQLRTDIVLEGPDRKLIIDTKCYGRILGQHYSGQILSANNVNQIFHYVVRGACGFDGEVSGMLLYALTRHEDEICESWTDAGYLFHCRTLNLNCDFAQIAASLDEIAGLL